jgi:hypothetical protein
MRSRGQDGKRKTDPSKNREGTGTRKGNCNGYTVRKFNLKGSHPPPRISIVNLFLEVSHLRRCGFSSFGTHPFRGGLNCVAPPALRVTVGGEIPRIPPRLTANVRRERQAGGGRRTGHCELQSLRQGRWRLTRRDGRDRFRAKGKLRTEIPVNKEDVWEKSTWAV